MARGGRARRRVSGNLPAELSGFVGRSRQIQDVGRLVSEARLVTLIGVGGVGKTTLALRVAREIQHRFSDGAWLASLADLAPTANAALVEQSVAASLGVIDFSPDRPLAALIEYLRDRHCVLVLDNCEHVVEEAGALVAALLSELSGLHVVATSREVLGCVGEHVVHVSPLALPASTQDPSQASNSEAVELLHQRAAAAGATLGTADLALAVELCRRLDGLPLAIELASSRLSSLSLTEILERLDDPFRLLIGGARHGPAGHRTLRRVMDWSYQLCGDSERLLWERVSVFVGGFDLTAAESVCSGDGISTEDVLDVLSSLARQSILLVEQHGDRTRYRLLETLRQYGQERLNERGVEGEFRRRHHDYYQQFAERAASDWCSPREVYWLERAQIDLPNLRAAMRHALDSSAPGEALRIAIPLAQIRVWFFIGWLGEGRSWLELGAAGCANPAEPSRITALALAGWITLAQGDVEGGRVHLRECLNHVESPSAVPAVAFLEAAYVLLVERDARSIGLLEQLVRRLQRSDAPLEQTAMIEMYWAIAAAFYGDRETALAVTQEYLDNTTRHGATVIFAWGQWTFALAQLHHGDRRRALTLVRESLRQLLAAGDRWGPLWGTYQIAWILAAELAPTEQETDPTEAARQRTVAETVAHVLGGAARMIEWTGVRLAGLGPFHAATEHAEQAARLTLGEQGYLRAYAEGNGTEHDRTRAYQRILATALNQPSIKKSLPSPHTDATDPSGEALTRREQEIAALVAQGMTNPEIARKLVLSNRTVQSHVGNILSKRGLRNRQEIAAWFARQRS